MNTAKSTVELFQQYFSESNLKHILKNYSETERGFRHPDGPLGFIVRDQGYTETYAGNNKLILTIDGDSVLLTKHFGSKSETFSITADSIIINGMELNKLLQGTSPLPGLFFQDPKASQFNQLSMIGPTTRVVNADGSIGVIIDDVPISQVFLPLQVLVPQQNKNLSAEVESYHLMKGVLGI